MFFTLFLICDRNQKVCSHNTGFSGGLGGRRDHDLAYTYILHLPTRKPAVPTSEHGENIPSANYGGVLCSEDWMLGQLGHRLGFSARWIWKFFEE